LEFFVDVGEHVVGIGAAEGAGCLFVCSPLREFVRGSGLK
jgi:hypothetical protein